MSTPFNFTFNPDEASTGFELIEKGEYEAFISDTQIKQFQSGNHGIAVTFTIRDDIEGQRFGKRKLWQNLVATEKAMFMFHTIAKAVGMPPGWTATSLEEYQQAIQSKPIRLVVGQKWETDNNGNRELRNNIVAFKESKAGGEYIPESNNPFAGTTPINISDDDLPF
jgi:hypothetical protein